MRTRKPSVSGLEWLRLRLALLDNWGKGQGQFPGCPETVSLQFISCVWLDHCVEINSWCLPWIHVWEHEHVCYLFANQLRPSESFPWWERKMAKPETPRRQESMTQQRRKSIIQGELPWSQCLWSQKVIVFPMSLVHTENVLKRNHSLTPERLRSSI